MTTLTTSQAATRAGVARSTINGACQRGKLSATKFGRAWMIEPAALAEWQTNHNANGGYPKGRPRKQEKTE